MKPVKIKKSVKKEMKQENMVVKELFLGDDLEKIKKDVLEGFLFVPDNEVEINRELIRWVPKAQYALIDMFFADYVNYVETGGWNGEEWTNEQANDIKQLSEAFYEIMQNREMYTFANKKITTIQEAIKEFKKISYFPPRIVIKDGLFIDIQQYFNEVIYF